MLVGIQQHPSFSAQTYFNYETLCLVQCFLTVFGIWPMFEMHRGMLPGYTFSCFHECFWHLVHFRNTQRHVAWLYFFSFSLMFFCLCWFQIVFGICPFSKCTGGMWSSHIFSRFHVQPQKSYQVNFRSVVQLK